jgi:transcriptional regulator with XRE-family HTH domain
MNTEEIREYIDGHGIKHTWVAEGLGISKSYLSLILSGSRVAPEWFEPKIIQLLKIGESNGEKQSNRPS